MEISSDGVHLENDGICWFVMQSTGVELLDGEWSLEPSVWRAVGGVMVTDGGEPHSGSSQFELG